ncbi:hypothetical protein BDY24DRAFT_413955 [Mrakia frigida]|uniref:uncharacterized protein n=1 Tax=Mrakia frigida TaxID=29902 RepID=UPI003FCBF79A
MPRLIDTEESDLRVQVPSSPSSAARPSPSSTTLAQQLTSQPIPIWPSTSNLSSLPSTSQRSPSPPALVPIPVAANNHLYSFAPQPPYDSTSLSSSSSSPRPPSSRPWDPTPALLRVAEHLTARGASGLRMPTPSQPGSSSSSSSAAHLSEPPHPFLASYGQQPAFDGAGYQNLQSWSPFHGIAQEIPNQASGSTSSWTTGAPHESSTREQQQAYYVRLQQQQHELLVAQAFASGRGRSQQQQQQQQQHQDGGSSSSSNGSQQRIEVVEESSRVYFPPPHLHTTQASTPSNPTTSATALSQPTAASSSNAAIQRTASANLGHRVYLLSCSHCALPLTDRGMKAVLLLKPHISLYSTDAVPVNVGPLFIPDGGGEAPKDGPERTCDCLTQGLGCCGCGSLLGYYIAVACSRCTSSVAKNQRSANGHRFVFHQNEVVSTERLYTPNEPGVVSSAFPFTSLVCSSAVQTANLSLSTANSASLTEDTAAHKRSTSASSDSDPSPTGSRPLSAECVTSRGRALLAGDVVFWRDLVKGGERVAPWFGPRDAGKKRRRDEDAFVNSLHTLARILLFIP